MNPIFKDYEIRQRHINATNGADCIGKLRKIYNGDGNFDLYYYPAQKYCRSKAKAGSGCIDSVYGDLFYIKCQLKAGDLDPHRLTKYGRRILKKQRYI